MTTFLIYTYSGDAELLLITLTHLKTIAGDSRIVVVDDAHHPMTKTHVEAVKALAEVQYSTHARNQILLGPEHTLYHARKMKELAPNPDDVVVKVDPDTLLLRLDWLKPFEQDKDAKLIGMFKSCINYTMGTYAVKGSILSEYVNDVELYPPWPQCYEDFEVSSRIYRLTKCDPTAIVRKFADGRDGWGLFSYLEVADLRQIIPQCEVLNGGMFVKNPKTVAGYQGFLKAVIEGFKAFTAEMEKRKATPTKVPMPDFKKPTPPAKETVAQ